jgi:hypothetical protein
MKDKLMDMACITFIICLTLQELSFPVQVFVVPLLFVLASLILTLKEWR